MGAPSFSGRGGGGGARIGQEGRHLTAVNMLSAFGRFNERGGGGGCCPVSADLMSGGGAGGGCCPLSSNSISEGCPPSRPIRSFNQWAKGAELLLQGGGGAIQSRRGGAMPPPGDALA